MPARTRTAPAAILPRVGRPSAAASRGRPDSVLANRSQRARPDSSVRVQMMAEPNAASATGHTTASPNHRPPVRSSRSPPATTRATDTICRTPVSVPGAGRGSVPSGASGPINQPNRYSSTPNPPAKASTTNASRTTTGSAPRRVADPAGHPGQHAVGPAPGQDGQAARPRGRCRSLEGSAHRCSAERFWGREVASNRPPSRRCSHTGPARTMGKVPEVAGGRVRVRLRESPDVDGNRASP